MRNVFDALSTFTPLISSPTFHCPTLIASVEIYGQKDANGNEIPVEGDHVKNEIKKVCNLVESANCIKYTGNDSVDSLLNAKINVAKEKNIAVKVTSWLSDFSVGNNILLR